MSTLFAKYQSAQGSDNNAIDSALRAIISSDPATISLREREGLIQALLGGLDKPYSAEETETQSLTLEALKILSRSPTGTSLLTKASSLSLLLTYAVPSSESSHGNNARNDDDEDVATQQRRKQGQKGQKDALAIFSNMLVLHTGVVRRVLLDLQVGEKILASWKSGTREAEGLGKGLEQLDLKGKGKAKDKVEGTPAGGIDDGLVFLFARVLVLMTAGETDFIRNIMDDCDAVSILRKELCKPYREERKMAVEEVLKVVYHLLVLYPAKNEGEWEDRFESLLEPLLQLFLNVPSTLLAPPLTNIINALTRFPFTPSLLTHWEAPTSILPKLIWIIHSHLDRVTPPLPWQPGNAVPAGWREKAELEGLEDRLTPGMLLLGRMAAGTEWMRRVVKKVILPAELDRSPSSEPLEKRWTLLGHLLRLMSATNNGMLATAAGELFWVVCECDATKLSTAIGYGNAAGLLYNKGMLAPPAPEALIEELPEETISNRNPITALNELYQNASLGPDMTPEEKEQEAERLMGLFVRMEKNPAMKMMENPMEGMVKSGKMEEWEKKEAEREADAAKKLEGEEEAEALRELAEYKKRVGK